MKKGRTIYTTGLAAALIVIMVAPALSQVQPVAARATSAVRAGSTVVTEGEAIEHVDLLVGRSAVIRTQRPIKRVALPKPDIADALNISRSKAFEICSAGELKTVRIGRSVRVPVEEVDRYIESKLSESNVRDNGNRPAGAS